MTAELATLFHELVRLETELWDAVDRRLRREHDLALAWFEPMQVIERTPSCRVLDIAEALSITVGGVSKVVDRIEEAGWCRRRPHPDDGRSSVITLTRPGQVLLSNASATLVDELDRRVGPTLTARELRQLLATIERVRAGIAIENKEKTA